MHFLHASVTSYRLSVIGYRLSVTRYKLQDSRSKLEELEGLEGYKGWKGYKSGTIADAICGMALPVDIVPISTVKRLTSN